MVGKYGIHDLPRAILVDQQGNVVHMNARGKQLAAELHRLLGQPGAASTPVASALPPASDAPAGDPVVTIKASARAVVDSPAAIAD